MEPLVNSRFNFADADVTLKSSDGVLFRIHRKNLEVCTEGFPPSEISSEGEVVELTETSVTLEIPFQFMYPQRHPALDTTSSEVLEPLAEAAEKYQVFPAMNICHIRMRCDLLLVILHWVAADSLCTETWSTSTRSKWRYMLRSTTTRISSRKAALMMIAMDYVKVVEMLPQNLILPWVRFLPSEVMSRNHVFAILAGIAKGFGAAADIVATFAMCMFLKSADTGIKRTWGLLKSLMHLVINRGILVTVAQIMLLITFFATPGHLYWLAIHINTTKLYINTFFGMLNARMSLQEQLATGHVSISCVFATGHMSISGEPIATAQHLSAHITPKREKISELEFQEHSMGMGAICVTTSSTVADI
ncbi:hypothetical protein MSAN_00491200 [Mycena sanguinolenta]|uniref:DUF6534 domain-containing protein n=1 Tax=Mycena sanguinolenta TaxID=230812 RepID=A0A8H7DH13_9AGAR|nr:hypothetical protein MSAN_00491200 [Mycena sanguinolenta]